MGPPLDGGGDPQQPVRALTARGSLQWGRRSMAAETRRVVLHADEARVASMGPPLDGGGDTCRARSRRAAPICFNGAAARWRRRHRPARGQRGRVRRLQWGRRSMAAETRRGRRGEGETSRASMGPPLDGGGDPASRYPTAATAGSGFNGAAARWRRRRRRPQLRPGGADAASMGPPLDGGGDYALVTCRRVTYMQLQWGRRSMAAETFHGGRTAPRGRRASMGPPLDGGGDAKNRREYDVEGMRASMGPPLDGGGDSGTRFAFSAQTTWLQWGRRSMAAETHWRWRR